LVYTKFLYVILRFPDLFVWAKIVELAALIIKSPEISVATSPFNAKPFLKNYIEYFYYLPTIINYLIFNNISVGEYEYIITYEIYEGCVLVSDTISLVSA
jgi:hypothetical protein